MQKEVLIKYIQAMPEEIEIDEILEKIIFISKIEEGLTQSDANILISHEAVKSKIASWLK